MDEKSIEIDSLAYGFLFFVISISGVALHQRHQHLKLLWSPDPQSCLYLPYLQYVDDQGEDVAKEEDGDDTEQHHGQAQLSLLRPVRNAKPDPEPDPLVRGTDLDPSVIKQN